MSITTLAPTTDVSVTIAFHLIDDADRWHLSAHYWRWCELLDRDTSACISQHPDYAFAATHTESRRSDSRSDPLDDSDELAIRPTGLVLCEATRNDQLVALGVLAPKSMSWRQAGGFGPARDIHGYRLCGNRLLGNPGDELQRQMLAACATFALEQHATFLLIEDLERDAPLFAAAESLTHDGFRLFSPTGIQERLKIEFPSKPDDYWSKFSSKTRNTFRRKQKKIGPTRVIRITEPGQVAEFIEAAHVISRRTWQSDQLGLRIRNNESELRLFTFLTTQRALRSYLLFVEDKPVAFLFGTQFKGLFSYEEVGYDLDYAERSPGQVLLLHVLDDLLKDDPPRVFDFGGGDADYKRLFATKTSTSGNVWLVPPGLKPQACLTYLRGCRFLDRMARNMVRRLGLTTLLRQLIRGKRDFAARSSARDAVGDDDGTDGGAS